MEFRMYTDDSDFLALAEQVRQGDLAAAARLRRDLEPRLAVIVGRALGAPSAALPLTRWIRAQALQLVPPASRGPREARGWLIAVLARRACDLLIQRLREGACGTRVLQETMCA
jgi:hypothetical protein